MSSGGGGFGGTISNAASGVGGLISDFTGQSAASQAQGQAANSLLGQQQSDRNQAIGIMTPSSSEIANLQQALAQNQQNISQSQQLLQSVDPAIQSLLSGGSSPLLAPIQNQRAQQRSALTQQLQNQLGSGYATSSAGIQALNNFDQDTANQMTQAQQSSLSQYGQLQSSLAGQQQYGFQNSLAGNQQQYGWQQGQLQALLGTSVNPTLGYAGQISQANANAGNLQNLYGQLWSNKSGIASGLTGMFSGSGGSGAAQTVAGGAGDAGGAAALGGLALA